MSLLEALPVSHCWSMVLLLAVLAALRNRNRNRNLQTSKAQLKSQAQGTSLLTSAALNHRGCPKDSPCEAQVRLPESGRGQIRR